MKTMTIVKKNKLLIIVALVYGAIFVLSPEKAIDAVKNSSYYLLEMIQVLPIIFLLTVVIDAWIPKEVIMKGLGEKSAIKGNLLSLVLGSVSAGPIYAAFPIGKTLLTKGASLTNIVIIISTWAVVKVPMLANEVKFLGFNFMAVRWVLTVISIFAMGYLAALIVKRKDIPNVDIENKPVFEIKDEYCIGCKLCVKMQPEFYEMQGDKAKVINIPKNKDSMRGIKETVEKCPSKAIVFKSVIKEGIK